MEKLIKSHSKAKQYAVYAHYYKGIPFYIGSGIYHRDNTSRSRAYDFDFSRRNQDWFNYCKGETEKIEVKILFTTNDRKLAFDKEEELTKTYIEKGYKLTNKNFGTYRSDETRNKISEALKGRKHSEETKKRMSLAAKGRKHSEEAKIKISLAKKGGNHPKAKKVLIINNKNGRIKVFGSIKDAHEFVSQNGFDKTHRTLQKYLKKGPFSFKNYTMEVTKDVAS